MSIQISGPVVLPDGSVTAAKIGSGAATDGQVLTADGAGGAAWEAAAGPGYLEYVALLTQSGTDAPVATVLKNTLGGTVVWTRTSAGMYRGTLIGAFPDGKTLRVINSGWDMENMMSAVILANNTDYIDVITQDISAFPTAAPYTDNAIWRQGIEIRVYP